MRYERDFIKQPAAYAVYCDVTNKEFKGTVFIGRAQNLEGVRQLIEEDRKGMCDTLGGLISAPGIKGRKYRIWMATWRSVEMADA